MNIGKRTNLMINATGISLVLFIFLTFEADSIFSYSRRIVLPLIFVLWLYAIRQRVIQKHTRRYLCAVAVLEIFWIIIRMIKFDLLKSVDASRICWYLYYLPMTMIPALCLLLAVSMGKPDDYRPGRYLAVFPVISAVLFLFVITNDLHGLVFDIPEGEEGIKVGNYSYGAVYFIIAAYMFLCYLASLGIIFVKSRVRGSKRNRMMPFIPLIFGAFVCVLYGFGIEHIGIFKIDITFFICTFISVTLEMCIQNRLILTNNGYDELFRMSGIRAVITDDNGSPVIWSDTYEKISPEDIKKAYESPVILKNGVRLSSAPIKHGRVLWQDDISELERVLRELSEINDYLQGKSAAVQQAYEYRKKERQLIEKNRLYNRVLTNTKAEIELYAGLVEQLDSETDS